jgi:hypothetical protein
MELSWIAPSDNGLMVGDYLGVDFSNGKPFGVFAVAKAPSGSTLNEGMYTTNAALEEVPGEAHFSSKGERAIAKRRWVRKFYDDDGQRPIPPSEQGPEVDNK